MSHYFNIEKSINRQLEKIALIIMGLCSAAVLIGFVLGWLAALVAGYV